MMGFTKFCEAHHFSIRHVCKCQYQNIEKFQDENA